MTALIGAGVLSGMAAVIVAGAPRAIRPQTSVIAEIERWAEMAGLGLQQASVHGHRFTPDGDIFDALDLTHARTLLSFDSKAARIRIESLPWVERASIERIVPDRLDVRVVERTPFAVWRNGTHTALIDKGGRVLGAVPADAMPELPRVAGKGAPTETAALFKRLAAYPELLRQLQVAERVGERRWSLHLAGGSVVLLPSEDEAGALARADALRSVATGKAVEIDLRVPGRPILRDRPNDGALQSASAGQAQGGS